VSFVSLKRMANCRQRWLAVARQAKTASLYSSCGSRAACNAGIDQAADAVGSLDVLVIAIDPGRFALAAAEDRALDAQLIERFSGYDRPLLSLELYFGARERKRLFKWAIFLE